MCSNRPPRTGGFTLVEMIVAIVIIGVGLAGVLASFNTSVRSSADPLLHKQMLAVAEEMMEEILLKPFAIVGTAPINAATNCGVVAASRAAFDDVLDYNNYQTNGVCDIDGNPVPGLPAPVGAQPGYTVGVTVAAENWQGIPVADALRITVTVTRGGDGINLTSWRTNYAL